MPHNRTVPGFPGRGTILRRFTETVKKEEKRGLDKSK